MRGGEPTFRRNLKCRRKELSSGFETLQPQASSQAPDVLYSGTHKSVCPPE